MSNRNKSVRIRLRNGNRVIVWEATLPGDVLDYTSPTAHSTFTVEMEIVENYFESELPPMDPT